MILIGQYDSPFVRRVGIAMRLYGFPFEHRPWSVFGNAAEIAPFNPLTRVPTLVLGDDEVLIESAAILDYLDERAGPDLALLPRGGPDRRHGLKICALSMGLADKAVSLVYERALHDETSPVWIERCRRQVGAVAEVLDAARAARPGPFWFGSRIGHPDIALACALRFAREAHPDLLDFDQRPALAAHAARCEALPVFAEISQRLDLPKR